MKEFVVELHKLLDEIVARVHPTRMLYLTVDGMDRAK